MKKQWLPVFRVMSMVWVLSACSGEVFHLRGSEPLPAIAQQGIFVQGVDPRGDFGIALQDGLEDAGAKLKKTPQDAGMLLTITNVRENRSVSGYSSTRQVREFNHSIDVDFRVNSKALPDVVERSVHVERSQVYDGQYVLGTSEEENMVKDELRREAVRLLLLRLQALSAKP